MADDDWSDSDDGNVETAVLLGVPDGPIESEIDLTDAAVSRIGGHPVRYVPSRIAPSLTRFSIQGFSLIETPRDIMFIVQKLLHSDGIVSADMVPCGR